MSLVAHPRLTHGGVEDGVALMIFARRTKPARAVLRALRRMAGHPAEADGRTADGAAAGEARRRAEGGI